MDFTCINELASTNIHIYDGDFDFIKENNMFNIIISKNGIYTMYKSEAYSIILLHKNIPYYNPKLKAINFDILFINNLTRPKIDLFEKILEIFKYMLTKKLDLEMYVNVYFDTIDKIYIIDIPIQKVSSILIDGDDTSKYEMDNRFIKYLQIHSHHSMSAEFSDIDDLDEKSKVPCIYGVVGDITSQSDTYLDVNVKFRIWNGFDGFVNLKWNDVFNINLNISKVSNDHKKAVNEIISEQLKPKICYF